MTVTGAERSERITVEFAGEYHHVFPSDGAFTVGREGSLAIDDNPFLHRHFLRISRAESLWWLVNVGTRLSATVTDGGGRVQSWLAPGARLPIVFHATHVVFSAGPTTYDFTIYADTPRFEDIPGGATQIGPTTLGAVSLTPTQHLLIVALAEPMLRREGAGMSEIPTSAATAERLGWTVTRFNRKLDNVCEKLDRLGVPGLRGGGGAYATNRRARLVEHALAARLVGRADLPLLDHPDVDDDDAAIIARKDAR
ncbi:hypothetical protein [Demequina sp.]|uniref:hypothetical protein n=1 Tax=Demequina sp. TaxID=2050685 RepID=UPI0025C1E2AD|nr:hypothetical protein [Demequina sp.]